MTASPQAIENRRARDRLKRRKWRAARIQLSVAQLRNLAADAVVMALGRGGEG